MFRFEMEQYLYYKKEDGRESDFRSSVGIQCIKNLDRVSSNDRWLLI